MTSADAELIAAEITVLTVRAKRAQIALDRLEERKAKKEGELETYEAENVA